MTTISSLPAAAALTGAEVLPMDQGLSTVKATSVEVADLTVPMGQRVLAGLGRWHYPLLTSPVGAGWPIINRVYAVPVMLSRDATATAIAMNQTTASAAGNVIRGALMSANASTLLPATVLYQSTVPADTAATKTFTFGAPIALARGVYWLVFGPQGTGSPGAAHLSSWPCSGLVPPFQESGASWGASILTGQAVYWDISGALSDNPSVTVETTSRNPFSAIRIQ